MKEKINKFLNKGYFILCCAWMEVAFLLYMIIDGMIECSWKQILFGVLTYTPWIILFFREYHFHKVQIEMNSLIKLKDLIRTIAGGLAYNLKRYRELYGELPEEETKKENKEE